MLHLVLGFPGPVACLVAELLLQGGESVCTVVSKEEAARLPAGMQVFEGDASAINFGLAAEDYRQLLEQVGKITCAETRAGFANDIEKSPVVRVACELREFLCLSGRKPELRYLSSLLIFGDKSGALLESDFAVSQSFYHPDEEAYAVAEKQVHALPSAQPWVVLRIAPLAGFEKRGVLLSGGDLSRAVQLAHAANDEQEVGFSDLPIYYETVERAARALVYLEATQPGGVVQLVDEETLTDRELMQWLFDKVEKRLLEPTQGNNPLANLLKSTSAGRLKLRTWKSTPSRSEAEKRLGEIATRDHHSVLARLFSSELGKVN